MRKQVGFHTWASWYLEWSVCPPFLRFPRACHSSHSVLGNYYLVAWHMALSCVSSGLFFQGAGLVRKSEGTVFSPQNCFLPLWSWDLQFKGRWGCFIRVAPTQGGRRESAILARVTTLRFSPSTGPAAALSAHCSLPQSAGQKAELKLRPVLPRLGNQPAVFTCNNIQVQGFAQVFGILVVHPQPKPQFVTQNGKKSKRCHSVSAWDSSVGIALLHNEVSVAD